MAGAAKKETTTTEKRGGGRTLIGVVTSDKMTKTVVVQVSRRVRSSAYQKYLTKRVKYKAHAETNDCKVGDTVQISESRPLSKDKRWRVEKVIERAVQIEGE
jgi:small subunit ribosomal protein S17